MHNQVQKEIEIQNRLVSIKARIKAWTTDANKYEIKELKSQYNKLRTELRQFSFNNTGVKFESSEQTALKKMEKENSNNPEECQSNSRKPSINFPPNMFGTSKGKEEVLVAGGKEVARLENDHPIDAIESKKFNSSDTRLTLPDDVVEDPENIKQPEWIDLYSRLPQILSESLKNIFIKKNSVMEIFTDFTSKMLWTIFNYRYSEIISSNSNFILEDFVDIETDKKRKFEFPCEQIIALNKSLKESDSFITKSNLKKSNRRLEFSVRAQMFRILTIKGIKREGISSFIDDKYNKVKGNIKEFVQEYHSVANSFDLKNLVNKSEFSESYFPMLLRNIRNSIFHSKPDWLKQKEFFTEEFDKACMSCLKAALIEWIKSENWLTRLSIGSPIGSHNRRILFLLDRPGSPPFLCDNQRNFDENTKYVIALNSNQILFPYIEYESGEK